MMLVENQINKAFPNRVILKLVQMTCKHLPLIQEILILHFLFA